MKNNIPDKTKEIFYSTLDNKLKAVGFQEIEPRIYEFKRSQKIGELRSSQGTIDQTMDIVIRFSCEGEGSVGNPGGSNISEFAEIGIFLQEGQNVKVNHLECIPFDNTNQLYSILRSFGIN